MTLRLPRVPAQSREPEWMDAPGHGRGEVIQNLGDLRRCNALLGGVRLTLRPLARLAATAPAPVPARPLRVLDVATGGADIPRALAARARRRRRPMVIVASDVSEQFTGIAREQSRAWDEIRFVVADGRRLPFVNGAFDVTTCSLALHHMLPEEALDLLAELRRCAALGVVVNDIVRGWLGYFGAFVATRLGSRNRLTWHDGPLSVLRAYTKEEMAELARKVGLRPVRWDGFLGYRVSLTAVPAKDEEEPPSPVGRGPAERAAGVGG